MHGTGPVAATVEVRIHGISSTGAGVGRLPDGRVVFVPGTAPGELARIRMERDKGRWASASLVEVLEPSPERRAPLCALYGVCGGCRLQHLPEETQRRLKAEMVAETLGRIGGLRDVAPPEVVPSPRATGYRSRMSWTLRRLGRGRLAAGLHALDRPAHVVDVHDECVLPEPEVARAWSELRRGWGEGAERLPAGGLLRLTLRAVAGGVSLLVEGGAAGWDAGPLRAAAPSLAEVVHRPGTAVERREASGAESHEAGEPAPGFEQVNREAADLLTAHVLACAGDAGGREPADTTATRPRAVDAYCGSGRYGHALARRGWRVVGIELDPEGARRARVDAPGGFEVREGDVGRILPDALPADLVILNPPRTGAAPEVTDALRRSPPTRLVYVSCDPATLARDLARLGDLYEPESIRCFDLFPQTAHVETVVSLSRRSTPSGPTT